MIYKKTLASLLGASVCFPARAGARGWRPRDASHGYDADPVSLDIHEQLSGGILRCLT